MPKHQSSLENDNREESPVVIVERLVIGDLLTEPLTKQEIAKIFSIGRNKVPELIPYLDAKKVCGKYRIPLRKMPPMYLSERNLI